MSSATCAGGSIIIQHNVNKGVCVNMAEEAEVKLTEQLRKEAVKLDKECIRPLQVRLRVEPVVVTLGTTLIL